MTGMATEDIATTARAQTDDGAGHGEGLNGGIGN
jgi:hypothetical protein